MKVEVPDYEIADKVVADPTTTAVLVGDMQVDFVRPDGKLSVPGAEATVEPIVGLMRSAREHGMRVFYTQDTHYPGDPEFDQWGEHCLYGSDGWEIIEELAPNPMDVVVRKRRYDGFYGTTLDHDLRLAGVETLICTGTVANICVLYTASGAATRWYDVILPVDTISALDPFDIQVAIRQIAFPFQGTITRSENIEVAGD